MSKCDRKGSQGLDVKLGSTDSSRTWPGCIHSFDRGLLRIDSSQLFEQGDEVEVQVGTCKVCGEVMYSVEKGESYRTAVALGQGDKKNRRAHRRIPVSWKARVAVVDEQPYSFDAEVVDVSSSGFGLMSPREVCASSRVAVETPVCVGFGEVLHCCEQEDGRFRLGVRLEELIGAEMKGLMRRLGR